MPGFENKLLQDMRPSSLLAELYGTDTPGVFQLHALGNPGLNTRPLGSIHLRLGNYPPGMCGSSVFDDALRNLCEDPTTFKTSLMADELLTTTSILLPPQQQENDDLLSSSSSWAIDALQAFNLGDYLQDFGGSVPAPAVGQSAPPGAPSMTVILIVPSNSLIEPPP